MTYTIVAVRINKLYLWPFGVYTVDDADPMTLAACHLAAIRGIRTIKEGVV